MEDDEFEKIIDRLKLLKMFITIKEIVKLLKYIHSKRIRTPMKIRSKSRLKKSAIYDYLGILFDLNLIVKLDLPRIHKDGSHFLVMTTEKLKEFIEDLVNYTKDITS
ncbi:MAG: hypothetical protein ACFFG0_41410 [Candidatus Thorarchaeota archaeon]